MFNYFKIKISDFIIAMQYKRIRSQFTLTPNCSGNHGDLMLLKSWSKVSTDMYINISLKLYSFERGQYKLI